MGTNTCDDAGVLRIGPELGLIGTVDLITPVTDDPFVYGQIAAANSLSDVYAMGGRPISALNICCFPDAGPAPEALARIIAGGSERLEAAGARLMGGHTVKDAELKYGMAVNGLVHPEKIVRNHTVQEGDVLFLSKPLGTGLLLTRERKGELAAGCWDEACSGMVELNRVACEVMLEHGVHAATDVTGFGFLGHLWEMLSPGGFQVELDLAALPVYRGAFEAAKSLGVSGPMRRNLEGPAAYLRPEGLASHELALLADPQTSGGLLMAIPADRADTFAADMHDHELICARVGQVLVATESRFSGRMIG